MLSAAKLIGIKINENNTLKNENGEYDTDFIPIVLKDAIGKNVCEYCKKGDILGIKGRTESIKEDDSYNVRIVAERVTFLSSKKEADKFD